MKAAIRVSGMLLVAIFALFAVPRAKAQDEYPHYGLNRFGIGVKVGTTGPGLEGAYEITQKMNIRGGFTYFTYDLSNTKVNGINFNGNLKLESGEVHLDYFLWRSLHVSPGLLFTPTTVAMTTMNVPGGQAFKLAGTTYVSDAGAPVGGNAALKLNTVAPSILFGFGNLVPRGDRRFSFIFEAGVAFRGSPSIPMSFTGEVCNQSGTGCQSTSTYPGFQGNVALQQHRYQNDLSALEFYPVMSVGIGFRL